MRRLRACRCVPVLVQGNPPGLQGASLHMVWPKRVPTCRCVPKAEETPSGLHVPEESRAISPPCKHSIYLNRAIHSLRPASTAYT